MKANPSPSRPRGFALIVTLSLMILLTIIAVGLLTLASVTLRTTSRDADMATARSNARLALMLAIGELQRSAGPDQRITAPATLVDANAPEGIAGVWKSWRPPLERPDYADAKSDTNFLGYLMSNPDVTTAPQSGQIPTSGAMQQLVGTHSVGTTNTKALISVPEVPIATAKNGKASGAFAYVTLDEGVKGRIDLMPGDEPKSPADYITSVGGPARNGFEAVEKAEKDLKFLNADRPELEEVLPKLLTLTQANLPSSNREAIAPYFHDFTVSSASLQADVANGGLKTDLSVLFDGQYGTAIPAPFSNRYIFSDDAEPMLGGNLNADTQWGVFANYSRLYRKTDTGNNPQDGMKAALPPGFALRTITDREVRVDRTEIDMTSLKEPMLMPTVLRVDTIFSIVARDTHGTRKEPGGKYPSMIHLMYLPVITLHNPYNVPLRVSNLSVEFSDIPIGFEFFVNDPLVDSVFRPATTGGITALNDLYWQAGGLKKTFKMLLSTTLPPYDQIPPTVTEVVMGAGETLIFGTPFSPDTSWDKEVNAAGQSTGTMFDYQSNKTAGAATKPGLITSKGAGVGFDIDWIAPGSVSTWLKDRQKAGYKGEGVVLVRDTDNIQIKYGPKISNAAATAGNVFTITMRMGSGVGTDYAKTQVFYKNDSSLKKVVDEGTSIRFPDARNLPEISPRATERPITAQSIYVANTTKIKDYGNAIGRDGIPRPFAIFSVSAKTTKESFTKSRSVADTGIAFQSAICNFTRTPNSGNSPLEIAMGPMTDSSDIQAGGRETEQSTPGQGFFFGGHGTRWGSNNAILYEIPLAPLQSIAQLRNANPGSISSSPYVTYTVGESRAHPGVPAEEAAAKPSSSRAALDKAWLANDQLWDKYFFSTIATLQGKAYSGASASTLQDLASNFLAGKRRLPNPRNVARIPAGGTQAAAATDMLATSNNFPYTRSAEFLLTRGGFNVNSTSVAAWTSILTALSDADVPLIKGNPVKNPPGTPFLRVRRTVAEKDPKQRLWTGYRTLEDAEIATLAEEIVKTVRERGPFLSMSDFVNRRLGSKDDEKSQKGAIQAALDRTSINQVMLDDADPVTPTDVTTYDWANPDAVQGNTGAGAPGEITQGDVLSAIGSFVSVRSDTFRIRAFGDARDAAGNVTARAWCEATLQRVPEYVDPTDSASALPTTPANLIFGRRFEVVSFRWLSKNDI